MFSIIILTVRGWTQLLDKVMGARGDQALESQISTVAQGPKKQYPHTARKILKNNDNVYHYLL